MSTSDLLFVGVNRRVAALDRESGQIVWSWRSPRGSGFATVICDGRDVFVSVSGYTYCLDARTGALVWEQPLAGFGIGVPCLALASSDARHHTDAASAAAQVAANSRAASRGSTHHGSV